MSDNLKQYNKKRNFEKTNEPKGNIKNSTDDKLHYVIQHHMARREHYDLRLEWNGSLLSWAIPKGPSYNPADKRLAVEVEPHPFDYKDFEGTIPKGEYGGGTVMLWDEGYWQPIGDTNDGLEKGSLKFILHGERLKGKWALVRLKQNEKENQNNWLLLKDKDDFSQTNNGINEFTTSVRTNRTMSEIEQGMNKKVTKNPTNSVDLQLAKLVDKAPNGDNWIFEPKFDGYRIVAFFEDKKARLITRNGKDYSAHFKDIATSLEVFFQNKALILDGEIVIIDENGKSNFQALQNFMKKPTNQELTYVIFDILALNGEDLRNKQLIDRKNILEKLMQNAPNNLYYSKHIIGNGKTSFESACEFNLEGIIGKKIDSIYSGTRNGDWIKLKCDYRQEFVVGGYTVSDKQNNGLSSLLLGYYDNNKLIYAGRAGTGYTEKDRKDLAKKLQSTIQENSPFENFKDKRSNEDIFWVQPKEVAEIKFAEWTTDNLLRQASFKGLRIDKTAKSVQREQSDNIIKMKNTAEAKIKPKLKDGDIEIGGIRVSNPNKVVFEYPTITKQEVVEYYAKVAEHMLMFVGGRILSTVRCPKGIGEDCFFKKHPGQTAKEIVVTPISTNSGTEDYFYIDQPKGFIQEAQMGTLEFHTWGSKVDNIDKPDMMVFDLDPDEGMPLAKIRQGAKDLKSVLEELSLESFLKVSGGKGYHIVVPFIPAVDWETFSSFAKRVAELMESKWADRYTSNIRKNKRDGKIFIDWVRNGRGATSIAPYSLRARQGANVALPIAWSDLDTIPPNGITMQNSINSLSKYHPWKNFHNIKQSLKP